MTHTVTDHKPETVTLLYGENNCGTKWVVATEGEKWGEKDPKDNVQYGSKNASKTKDT